ncbi:glycosyltransferase [Actinomadura luteofluorescens]|uniref:glycosyltransferase n=1 Tax=Actinomadura luteofluorescens TaxID=46163 RepID=UPI003642A5F4
MRPSGPRPRRRDRQRAEAEQEAVLRPARRCHGHLRRRRPGPQGTRGPFPDQTAQHPDTGGRGVVPPHEPLDGRVPAAARALASGAARRAHRDQAVPQPAGGRAGAGRGRDDRPGPHASRRLPARAPPADRPRLPPAHRRHHAHRGGPRRVRGRARGVRRARRPDPERRAPLPPRPSRRVHKVVLAAGRLVHAKGFDVLLRAFVPIAAEHPDWTLRVFGGGPRRDRLRALIDDLGLGGRAEVRPRTRDLHAEMERASVYALSSRREGMPMVVIEAMGMGLAVVAFDCPTGLAEVIAHGRDGLLVPAGDEDALTAALRAVIEDPGLRDRLGEAALRSSRAHHLDRIGPRWSRLIRDLAPVTPRCAGGRAAGQPVSRPRT